MEGRSRRCTSGLPSAHAGAGMVARAEAEHRGWLRATSLAHFNEVQVRVREE